MIDGTVLYGINNVFSVETRDGLMECRIKGKVLKATEGHYNALASGDLVAVEPDALTRGFGQIVDMKPRRNAFYRYNEKGRSFQAIAANLDAVYCVCCPESPPFRPRFVDRAEVLAEYGEVPFGIVMNKADQEIDPAVDERLEDFARIGIEVVRCSAKTGVGIEGLTASLSGRTVAFMGQSGVGKSSILNAIHPGFGRRIGELSDKYDRGCHTTNFAVALDLPGGGRVIDTPGVRRLALRDIEPERLSYYFREFREIALTCTHGASCTHVDEPGCRILEAVYSGLIHEDRYESYLRIREELLETFTYPRKR